MNNTNSWAIKLFNKSPLKQKKYQMITSMIGEDYKGKCLDIGSDNGVISYFLREKGGEWVSADLIPETVESIKSLVKENVFQIDELKTPFNDNEFDLVVIVDYLEHIETDKEFVLEIKRILKPNGTLICNVPNPNNGPLRWVRHLIGQTDEAHGHVRPGYNLKELKILLGDDFKIEKSSSYSRFFSAFIDTGLTFGMELLKGKGSKKGTVMTGADLNKFEKSFKLYSLIYPIVALFVKLDDIFFFLPGNMLIARVKLN